MIETERVTVLVGVPMALSIMLRMQDLDRYDLSSLLICGTGSAPCPPSLGRQIQKRFGCALHIGFGTTELACRSDSMMLGYWHTPETSSDIIDEQGWYYTGDLATIDERGYLRIVGRKKDMIIRGGQNVYPAEIENYLVTHAKVREAAVVGILAPIGGERAWAFVILEEGAMMTAREILDYCRSGLEATQIPDRIRFVTDFPRTDSGKAQKFILRDMTLQEIDTHIQHRTSP